MAKTNRTGARKGQAASRKVGGLVAPKRYRDPRGRFAKPPRKAPKKPARRPTAKTPAKTPARFAAPPRKAPKKPARRPTAKTPAKTPARPAAPPRKAPKKPAKGPAAKKPTKTPAKRPKAKPTKPKAPRVAYVRQVRAGKVYRDVLVDPKTGRFTKAGSRTEIVREVKHGKGKRKALRKTSQAKTIRRKRASIGEAFTDDMRPGDTPALVTNTVNARKRMYVKIGGRVYLVPATKAPDLISFLIDTRSKFFQTAKALKVSSPDLWLSVSIGDKGSLINLDQVETADPELMREFEGSEKFMDNAKELSVNMAARWSYYMGDVIPAKDIAEGLNSPREDQEEDEE